jgi:hypothetical protein
MASAFIPAALAVYIAGHPYTPDDAALERDIQTVS